MRFCVEVLYVPREHDIVNICRVHSRSLPLRKNAHLFYDISEMSNHGRSYHPNLLCPLFTEHKIYWDNQERHLVGAEHIWSLDVPFQCCLRDITSCGCRVLAGNSQTVTFLAALDCCMLSGVDWVIDIGDYVTQGKPKAGVKRGRPGNDISDRIYNIPPHPHSSHMMMLRE